MGAFKIATAIKGLPNFINKLISKKEFLKGGQSLQQF